MPPARGAHRGMTRTRRRKRTGRRTRTRTWTTTISTITSGRWRNRARPSCRRLPPSLSTVPARRASRPPSPRTARRGGGGGDDDDGGGRRGRRCRLALRGGRRQSRPPQLRVDERARRGRGTARHPGCGGSSPRADRRECRRGPRRGPAVPDIGWRERLGPQRRRRGRGGGSRGQRGRRAGGRTCTSSSRGRADPAPARR